MKIKGLLLLTALITSVTAAQARPYPDYAGVCTTFKGDNVVSKDVCVVSFSEGAGGKLTVLKTFNKTYSIDAIERRGSGNYDSDDINDSFKFTINGEASSGEYYRHASFYNKVSVDELEQLNELEEEYLYCYKSKSVDICHS
ncbi:MULTISPECIES: hypothetical protein [Psychrobacter]|uniref:hypothetical protein n=1 Tax=Psychrobacter TaxID=497 RepID=UPI00146CDC27|nr:MULTISPECIES: hypothetical protein [Psychrobacter]